MRTHSWVDRHRSFIALLMLAGVTGCVSQGPLGVRVRGAQTDVAFGALTRPPLANFPAPTPAPAKPPTVLVEQLFPEEQPPPDNKVLVYDPSVYAAPKCPDAGLNDFPAEQASNDIKSLPAAGEYRWKQDGKQPFNGNLTIKITGFQSRYLRRVTGAAGSHSFQTLQLDQTTGRILASTFRVKSQSTDPVDDAVNPVGLTLFEVDELDAKGQATPILQPNPPLVYLPLPVTPGASFSSKSIDSTSGAVLTMEAMVKGRQRVDACGDIVDGWLVTSTQSFTPKSGGARTSRSYDFVVATQLGGALIFEHIKSGSNLDVTFSLGQLVPGPLPANVK